METKEIKIRYRAGMLIDTPDYKEYEYDYISAQVSSVKRYRSAVMVLMGISGCELHLLEYLTDQMSEGGMVHNNEMTRNSFISFHAKHKKPGNRSYSDHAVQKAFQKLTVEALLIPVVRGVYKVSPMYYFAKSDEERVKSIKMMMEFKAGIETKISVEVKK